MTMNAPDTLPTVLNKVRNLLYCSFVGPNQNIYSEKSYFCWAYEHHILHIFRFLLQLLSVLEVKPRLPEVELFSMLDDMHVLF